MKVFWKVHINNFEEFVNYINKKYNDKKFNTDIPYSTIKERYYNNSYLYLSVDDFYYNYNYYCLRQMPYEVSCFNELLGIGWEYMDEFNLRKNKLIKLNKISKR